MSAFWLYLGLLELYVLGELLAAYLDGYAFDWQVRRLPSVPKKYLAFWGHAGMHGDFWLIGPTAAYILSVHATSWPLFDFALIFAGAAFAGAILLVPLLQDSRTVPSALARDGYLPLAGAMHYLYYTVGTALMVAYYLLTPRADVAVVEVVVITMTLIVHWGLGVLQPPKKVHGKIHLPAKILTVIGGIALIGLAGRLLFYG